jgi:hypothetical protein
MLITIIWCIVYNNFLSSTYELVIKEKSTSELVVPKPFLKEPKNANLGAYSKSYDKSNPI